MDQSFLSGVVEGFYGQPWSQSQRFQLFDWMAAWALNTYFYAPKDDLKHRAAWREAYSDDELKPLGDLIVASTGRGLRFIYGLSPGLDIRYGDPQDRAHLKHRFAQLLGRGTEHFALLFDDIPGALTTADARQYDSFAAAQSEVANDIFRWVRGQRPDARFLFCPTAYCDRMDRLRLGGAGYLETIGRLLDPAIDILWTGPEIVSREIPVESIRELALRIRRPPVIWDNLHANDYDIRRLYCGPYSGRAPELRQQVRGILANPNNEFPINYVPLRTMAAYLGTSGEWQPRDAYLAALREWWVEYETLGRPLSFDDLILLGDCYYLPHEEGPEARNLYELSRFLVEQPPREWGDRLPAFLELNRRVQALFEGLTELRRRDLFHAWSRRAWELKEEMQLIETFTNARRQAAETSGHSASEGHLPGTYRGGLVARLQRLLTMDDQGVFRPAQPERRPTSSSMPGAPQGGRASIA